MQKVRSSIPSFSGKKNKTKQKRYKVLGKTFNRDLIAQSRKCCATKTKGEILKMALYVQVTKLSSSIEISLNALYLDFILKELDSVNYLIKLIWEKIISLWVIL